jgi:putative two-component system response regulator
MSKLNPAGAQGETMIDTLTRAQAASPATSAPIECLVVDDEPRLRHVLVQLMQADGYRCREAGTGVEALARLEERPVELLLSDVRMPTMDGLDLLKEVRARWPDTAAVMVTAVADVEVGVACLALGAMDYLTKPFHFEEVRARVRQALDKRRLILENQSYQMHLEARVAAQARRIEELFLAGVQALAEALEVKDPYTRGHSVRVSQYAEIIARALDLDAEVIRQIRLGGHVHDIGKIGVREEVLNKPEALTVEEYHHIMTHPVTGWRILAPLMGDAPIALNIVRSHHERVDGTGVPDAMRGDQIPLEARIVAVADALDAMTSGRRYRHRELTFEGAICEIERSAGTQFDAGVVETLRRVYTRGDLRPIRRSAEARLAVSL